MPTTYYVKISKIDANGDNYVNSLQQLDSFIVKYTSPFSYNYIINNIVEYPTYYLYYVDTGSNGYSNDTEIKDYKVIASASALNINAGEFSHVVTYNNVTSNIIGYLTGSNGSYMLHNTPNIPLYYTFSCIITSNNGSPVTPWISLYKSGSVPLQISANTGVGPFLLTLSGSIMAPGNPSSIENELYSILLSEVGGASSYSASAITFVITQSYPPQAGILDLLVLSPNFVNNFENSNYNVLYGNSSESPLSQYYQKIDYSAFNIDDEDFSLIISGSATKANVKDYYYYLNRHIIPRYLGSRSTSPNFNLPAFDGLGLNPNAERTTPYFIYFTQMVDDSPLIKDVTSVLIKCLVDENGNIFSPSTNDSTYYDLIDSFEVGKNAYANLFSSTTNIFNHNQQIRLSGKYYKPILYSISASSGNTVIYSTGLDFLNLQGSLASGSNPDYSFYRRSTFTNGATNLHLTSGSNGTYLLNGVLNPFFYGFISGSGYDSNSDWVTGFPTGDPTNPYFQFTGIPGNSVNIECHSLPYVNGISATIELQIILDRGGNVSFLATNLITPSFYSTTQYTVKVLNFYPQNNDKVYYNIKYIAGSGTGTITVNNFTNDEPNWNSYFKITPNSSLGPSVSSPFYWTTGSANSFVITSSAALGLALQGNYIQQDIPDSGFTKIEDPAQIFVGDEFRFEYDEVNTYYVIDVQSFSSSQICVFFDRYVPTISSINIDHFLVRRPFKNTTLGVTLNAKLTNNITNGFLFPEYPTQKLKDNLPNIIQNLQAKNII